MSIASRIKSLSRRLFSSRKDLKDLEKLIEVKDNGDVILYLNGSRIAFTVQGDLEVDAERLLKLNGNMVFIKPADNFEQIEEAYSKGGKEGVRKYLEVTEKEKEALINHVVNHKTSR